MVEASQLRRYPADEIPPSKAQSCNSAGGIGGYAVPCTEGRVAQPIPAIDPLLPRWSRCRAPPARAGPVSLPAPGQPWGRRGSAGRRS